MADPYRSPRLSALPLSYAAQRPTPTLRRWRRLYRRSSTRRVAQIVCLALAGVMVAQIVFFLRWQITSVWLPYAGCVLLFVGIQLAQVAVGAERLANEWRQHLIRAVKERVDRLSPEVRDGLARSVEFEERRLGRSMTVDELLERLTALRILGLDVAAVSAAIVTTVRPIRLHIPVAPPNDWISR